MQEIVETPTRSVSFNAWRGDNEHEKRGGDKEDAGSSTHSPGDGSLMSSVSDGTVDNPSRSYLEFSAPPTTWSKLARDRSIKPKPIASSEDRPGKYSYGHPYYVSPYYAANMKHFSQDYGQSDYAEGTDGAKAGMYNQPHHEYGIQSLNGTTHQQ